MSQCIIQNNELHFPENKAVVTVSCMQTLSYQFSKEPVNKVFGWGE